MKCVCGYKSKYNFKEELEICASEDNGAIYDFKSGDGWLNMRYTTIFICPKCGTLKVYNSKFDDYEEIVSE